MTTTMLDSPRNPTSNQLGNINSKLVHKSPLLPKANANETNSVHKNNVSRMNDDMNNLFKIYHQNIRGFKGKINEFMLPLHTEVPHLICLTEHHLKNYEINVTPISKYKLGANYCRKKLKNGGVCIYILETLKFINTDLQKHCKEQDIEIAAVKIRLIKKNVIIFPIYRAPSGNFDYFLNKLDTILNSLRNHKTEFILCGGINKLFRNY
jgi:exonuclease III